MSVEVARTERIDRFEARPFDMPDVKLGPKITEDRDNIRKALTSDGKLLAMKEVKATGSEKDLVLVEELGREIDILSNASHENIVQYRYFSLTWGIKSSPQTVEDNRVLRPCEGINVSPQSIGHNQVPSFGKPGGVSNFSIVKFKLRMYMDFVRHDTLEMRYFDFPLSEAQVGLYTRHILSGIEYLHNKNIVHRDIRCANIWVDDQGVCKLVNFGKAKELHHRMEEIRSSSTTGKPHWMAPEIAANSQGYQKPVDIWSLGCTVLEMLTRRKPHQDSDEEVTELEVLARLKGLQGPTIPDSLSEDARNLLNKCLQVDPKNRPTAKDLLEDIFVNPPTPTTRSVSRKYSVVPVESPPQEDYTELSVEEMCGRVSEELENNAADTPAVIISSDWLEKWQSDDDQVYTKLMHAGYVKTFETATYACFENIFRTSEGRTFDDLPAPSDEYLNSVVAEETTQEGTRNTDSSRPQDNASESVSHGRINPSDSGSKSGDEVGRSTEHDVFAISEGNDFKVSGTSSCTEQCPHIPLTVVHEGASSSSSTGRHEAKAVMDFNNGQQEVRVPLSLSCCARGNQVCIKFSRLKGEIFYFPEGAVLRETRLSVAAKVDGVEINLTPVDPDNGQPRICSTGKAQWDCYQGKQGNFWFLRLSPGFHLGPFGGGELGELSVMKNQKPRVLICSKNEPLDLVTLKVGDAGCRRLDYRQVLVLNRHVANTWIARQDNDLTCVDSHASDKRPIILEGTFELEESSCGDHGRSIEITCCVELDTDVIPGDKIEEKIKKEMMCAVTRKRKCFKLCESLGHCTFKGTI